MPTKKQRGGSGIEISEQKAAAALLDVDSNSAGELNGHTTSISREDLDRLEGLALRLRATRKRRGFLIAKEFCDMAGVSKQYLGNIELQRTKRPEALPMVKIARALNVSLEWLLTGEGIPAGEVKDISSTEFDLITGFRSAKPEEKNIIQMILAAYITQPGKAAPKPADKSGKKLSPRKKQ